VVAGVVRGGFWSVVWVGYGVRGCCWGCGGGVVGVCGGVGRVWGGVGVRLGWGGGAFVALGMVSGVGGGGGLVGVGGAGGVGWGGVGGG